MDINKENIKLLYYLPSFTFGGAERTSLNLLKRIDKIKFNVYLVTSKKVYEHFKDIGLGGFIPVEDLGIEVWFNSLKRFISDVRRTAFLLKNVRPDIAFGMMHYPSSLLVFAKKIYNLDYRVIVSPRGPSTEYLKYFENNIFRKLWLKWIFSFFCRFADGIIVASKGMKEECIRDYHAIPEQIEVIPNSIDISDIKRKAKEDVSIDIPADFKVIATAGRIEREKNLPVLIKAISEIKKQEKVKLLIIGDGSEKKSLELLSESLGIREDVIFVGYQKNLYKFIRIADIFVHTCLFEGFANVIIEAMVCGVPVIAMDCPYGPRDIIDSGVNGLLVPIQSEELLIGAISTLLKDEQLRKELSIRGLKRALDFSVDNMVGSYQRFFENIVQ